jgi:hypothetical protein
MEIKYNGNITNEAIDLELKKITNQIYKLLPSREEGLDWEKPLKTIQEELAGMDRILLNQHTILFPLMCKLEGLFVLIKEEDFFKYRGVIFECLGLMGELRKQCQV